MTGARSHEEVRKSFWAARYVIVGVLCASGAPADIKTRAQKANDLDGLRTAIEAGIDYVSPGDQVDIHRMLREVVRD